MVQAGYVCAQLFCFGIYYYTTFVIKKKNDKTVIKYAEPAKPMSSEAPVEVQTTVREYDLAEVTKAVRGLAIGIAIMAFMHFYMKYTQPLFIQSILPVKGLYDSKVSTAEASAGSNRSPAAALTLTRPLALHRSCKSTSLERRQLVISLDPLQLRPPLSLLSQALWVETPPPRCPLRSRPRPRRQSKAHVDRSETGAERIVTETVQYTEQLHRLLTVRCEW